MPTRYGAAIAVLAVAAQLAGCGQNASEQTSDIGSNPPPVEFQAACLRLPRGAVVSFTHTPTLGVVLRTMSLKDHMRVRWERVSDNAWIQRIEGADPLTGKETEVGIMFEKVGEATSECPNGSVLLARMVVNGDELAPTVMNDGFVSMLDVAALNRPTPNARTTPQPEPALPQPDPVTGCYDDDCPPPAGSYIPEGSGDTSIRAGNHPPCYTREDGTLACEPNRAGS